MRYFLFQGLWCFLFSALLTAGTNQWTGKTSDWFSGENWSTGKAPVARDGKDVLISGGVANYPVLTADAAVDGSLVIEKNARLTLAGHNLKLTNLQPSEKKGILVEGTLDASHGNSIITVGPGGLTNLGKIVGTPALVLAGYCYHAAIKAGGASFSSLTLPPGSYSYRVTLTDSLTLTGNLILNGHGLFVPRGVTLTIQGDLAFSGGKESSASLAMEGQVFLNGNLFSDDSAVCGGGKEKEESWVIFLGKETHLVEVTGNKAILPPLGVSSGTTVRLKGNLACAGLKIEKDAILDASAVSVITFGGSGIVSHCRGLINEGEIIGRPRLVFSSGCYHARLKPKEAIFTGLTVDTGNYAYSVTQEGNLTIQGDVLFKVGSFNLGENVLTITGSCFLPPVPEKPRTDSFRLNFGKKAQIVFTGPQKATIESGGTVAKDSYSSIFPSLTVDKPASTLTITKAPLEVNGTFKLSQGILETKEGGELWLGVVRDTRYAHYEIHDVGLKLQGPLTKDQFPEIKPAVAPEALPGVVTLIHNQIGPELPKGLELANIAPAAKIRTIPYTTMVRLLVDPDEKLRTMPEPEKGTPVKTARYYFHFDTPQEIVAINWAVPSGPWAILVDTNGDGVCEKLLRADLEGKITNPGGVWKARTWIKNTFQPSVQNVSGILLATFGPPRYYDVQILVPKKQTTWKPAAPTPKNIPEIKGGEPITLRTPEPKEEVLKGFHIEPWMFNILGWLNTPKEKRPPLREYEPFLNFVTNIKKYHANVVNMWPPRNIQVPRGKGTYESDVLWPSQYDRWSLTENALKEIAEVFQASGLKLFTMDRCVYPKKLEEFPPSDTRDKPAPYISRHTREFLKGFVLEQVKSGVNGVGIGYDEQMGGLRNPANVDEATREAFQKKYNLPVPDKMEDTEAFRKWIIFGYEQFASYLAEAAAAAKAANPEVFTKTPVHVCLGNLWNGRIDLNIAEDIVGHMADIDFFRAYCYQNYGNLNHFVSAANTLRMLGANRGRAPASLHNCPWANDPVKYPGYYLDTTPAWMYGPPVVSFMHGGRLPLYWRYNFIFYGGYEKYVEQAYSLLDTLAVWGAKEARIPRQILVLKSRASEDWWQVRQRYNPEGNPADQTRGFIYEKWLLEFLLSHGYPFRIYYLEHPEDFASEISAYPLVILPFPYSISREAFQKIEKAAEAGTKILLLDRQGETDEWGNFYPVPLFSGMVSSGKALLVKEDIVSLGHNPDFLANFQKEIDKLLGPRKLFFFNSEGNDVETAIIEKGDREKFVLLLNWTDRAIKVTAGLNLPPGTYEAFLRDLDGVRKAVIGPETKIASSDLQQFLVSLEPWEMKILYVKGTQ
ncbi:MAG: hypothetical protein NC911_00180 [Candidatus Omnitrophica bacterium]|nr:hypothetical protein [Candidatus Omnitrophota bacterium]